MNLSESKTVSEKKRKVKNSSSKNDTSFDLERNVHVTDSKVKHKKKKPKRTKNVTQTTLHHFNIFDENNMDTKINEMEKTLDLVLNDMLKASDLDEKLKPLVTTAR